MKGTEKQITWATEIQINVVSALNTLINGAKAEAITRPEYADRLPAVLAQYEAIRDKVSACDRASDLIDVFKGVRGPQDWKMVMAAIKVSDPDHIFH